MNTAPLRALALCAALVALAAVPAHAQDTTSVPAAGPAHAAAPAARPHPRRSRDVIEQEEIQGRSETDAFALIATLRPAWLRVRGGSGGVIQVYVNGQRRLNAMSLRDVIPANILKIEHLDGGRATERYGVNHVNGAILVTTL